MVDDTPAKKSRRPRAELKELMIQGGVDVLRELGVETQLSSVSYAKVFEHLEQTHGIKVTYGSVHERIWNSLQEYQLSVIQRAGLWDDHPGDRDAWVDWLQTMVAMSSSGADETVRGAAAAGAQANYAARTAAFEPGATEPATLLPAGADADEILATLSLAVADGLRLRGFLVPEDSSDVDLNELGTAILRAWFRDHRG
ncbi:MAG: hypothetical protein RIB98_18350 [Acidimicrobiales bacterium]